MPFEKSTLKFLKDLEKNNDREWFLEHKERYVDAQQDMKVIAEEIKNALNKKDEIS